MHSRRVRVPAFRFPSISLCGVTDAPVVKSDDSSRSPFVVSAMHNLIARDGEIGRVLHIRALALCDDIVCVKPCSA